jgi:hypothetical protein
MRRSAAGFTWLFAGKLAQLGANAATLVLLAYRLRLSDYGLFVTLIGAQLLLSRGVLVGMDGGLLRLSTLPEWRDRPQAVVQAGLVILLATSSTIVVGVLIAVWVLTTAGSLRWPAWELAGVAAGAIGVALVDYGSSYRLTRLEFRGAAVLQGGTAVVRLSLTAIALWRTSQQPCLVFLAYAGTSLFMGLSQAVVVARESATVAGIKVLSAVRRQLSSTPQDPSSRMAKAPRPRSVLARYGRYLPVRLPVERVLVQRLIGYSIWKGGTDFVMVFALNQGLFLLMLLGQKASAGLFGLGLTLSLGFLGVYQAFGEYLVPWIVRLASPERLPRFLARAFGAALAVAMACVPLLLAVGWAATWVLRADLRAAVSIFYWLAVSMLLLILEWPLAAACYYLVRPQLVTLGLTLRVLFTGALGLVLVPAGGAASAAVAQLVGTALGITALVWLVWRALLMTKWEESGS